MLKRFAGWIDEVMGGGPMPALPHVVKLADERGEFVMEVDGFYYWAPTPYTGHFSEANLRLLAEELRRRNAAWESEIADYFVRHPERR